MTTKAKGKNLTSWEDHLDKKNGKPGTKTRQKYEKKFEAFKIGAVETVKELPNEFDLEELIEKLVFVEKVEKGLKQLDEGKAISHESVKEITKKW